MVTDHYETSSEDPSKPLFHLNSWTSGTSLPLPLPPPLPPSAYSLLCVPFYLYGVKSSNFREIPDNQEVYVSNQNETSLMVDILERVDCPDNAAAEFHFDALATDNEVDEDDTDVTRVFNITTINAPRLPYNLQTPLCQRIALACFVPGSDCRGVPAQMLSGYQRVLKGHYRSAASTSSTATNPRVRGTQSEYVILFLMVLRLQDQNTDVVISVNYPVRDHEGVDAIHADLESVQQWIQGNKEVTDAERVLKGVIESFEVVDWSLFDEDEDDEEEE